MARKYAEVLLIVVIALRSTALLFSKIALAAMGPLTLLGLRFLLAFAVLFIIFFKRIVRTGRSTLLRGLLLGSLFYATMAFELIGLDHTSSSTTAFLENTAIMFVPLFDAVLRRCRPRPSSFISGLTALAGVAFLTLHNGRLSLGAGEGCCMLAALFYAATIVATDRLAKKDDAMVLGVLQVGVIGLFGAVSAFVFEQPTLAAAVTWGPATWAAVAFLAVVCTVFGFTLQPVAQKYTTSEKAGLYCAINPLIAAVLGYTFLQEAFTRNSILGAALIIGSIVVSALLDQREAERETRRLAGSGCGV